MLKDGKSSSTGLSKADADTMGSGDLSKLNEIESRYQTKSTLKQMATPLSVPPPCPLW